MDTILIFDFGSQTTQLIGRRIRDMGVYTEIIPGDSALSANLPGPEVKGIILSGSPESVYDQGGVPDKAIYTCGLPLLGICYGLQRMTFDLGGAVEPLPKREYGRIGVKIRGVGSGEEGGKSPPSLQPFGFLLPPSAGTPRNAPQRSPIYPNSSRVFSPLLPRG